jgi:hypothetical protein
MSGPHHQGPRLRANDPDHAAGAGARARVGAAIERHAGRARRSPRAMRGHPEDAAVAAPTGFLSAGRALERRRRRDANDG